MFGCYCFLAPYLIENSHGKIGTCQCVVIRLSQVQLFAIVEHHGRVEKDEIARNRKSIVLVDGGCSRWLLVLSQIPEGGFIQVVYRSAIDPVESRFHIRPFKVNVDALPRMVRRTRRDSKGFELLTAQRVDFLDSSVGLMANFPRTRNRPMRVNNARMASGQQLALTVDRNPADVFSSCLR